VVVDPPEPELLEGRQADGGEEAGDEQAGGSRQPPGGDAGGGDGEGQPEQGPQGPRRGFGVGRRQAQSQQSIETRDAAVDQPRPVHQGAGRELQAEDLGMVPGAPRQELAHKHQTHGVIRVAHAAEIERQGGQADQDHRDEARQGRHHDQRPGRTEIGNGGPHRLDCSTSRPRAPNAM
jgi:hypothetical protein